MGWRDWENYSVQEKLDWYFGGEAEAELGARSVQGGFEAAMCRMELSGPSAPGQMHVQETRPGAPDLEVTEKQLEAARRSHEVRCRLDLLQPRNRSVLEVHFGDPVRVLDVSVGLLCVAQRIQKAVDRVNTKRRRKGEAVEAARTAVLTLSRSKDAADRAVLEALVVEASAALRAALEAYCGVRPDAR